MTLAGIEPATFLNHCATSVPKHYHTHLTFFFLLSLLSNSGHGLLQHDVYRSHTTTHHSRQDSSGRVINSSKRPLPDNTQHSQQTNIHALGGIRTHNPSKVSCRRPTLLDRTATGTGIHIVCATQFCRTCGCCYKD